MSIALTGAAILLLLGVSAFFSGSETALTAASRARMHARAQAGDPAARAAESLMNRRERLIGALLLGNNTVNTLAAALATSLMVQIYGDAGVALATFAMTAALLIFSEVLPKAYAIADPDRRALMVARPVRVLVWLLAPVVAGVHLLVAGILAAFGLKVDPENPVLTAHEEIRGAIALHHRAGAVVKDARDMLGGVLDLREVAVVDVMTHRKAMAMIDADQPADVIVEQVLSSPYSRIPLWRGDPENIVGLLHVKSLLRALKDVAWDLARLDVDAIAAPPWFVPETTTLKEQLDAFLERKTHVALVVDEYGALMGLVTLEDIIEEIVGEISDEHDVAVKGVRPQADGSIVVDGAVPVRDLNRALDFQLPDSEATTIAGLVIHEARLIPEIGQIFSFHGFRFEILRRQRNQVTAIRVTPPPHLARPARRLARGEEAGPRPQEEPRGPA